MNPEVITAAIALMQGVITLLAEHASGKVSAEDALAQLATFQQKSSAADAAADQSAQQALDLKFDQGAEP